MSPIGIGEGVVRPRSRFRAVVLCCPAPGAVSLLEGRIITGWDDRIEADTITYSAAICAYQGGAGADVGAAW